MEFNREPVIAAFLAESAESLQEMEQALLAVESDPGNTEMLNRIFRVAHTIKGNATALEFEPLAAFAHVVEDLLEALRKQTLTVTPNIVSLLLRSVDVFRQEIPRVSQGASSLLDEHLALQQQLAGHALESDVSAATAEPSPAAASASPAAPESRTRTLRVDVSKLDVMLDLSGEIAIAQGRMARLLSELPASIGRELIEAHRENETLCKQLQEQVMNVRLLPIGPLFQQFMRPVRDMARSLGKVARLEISGADTEVDTRIYELLKDPLLHMIRNALDHGIEAPDVRQARGKNRCGTISLSASHTAGAVVISMKDDGAGFDREKILASAKAAGIFTEGKKLSDSEVFRLCFAAGISTSTEITELSGRGVGMDVVQRNIDAMRGKIEVESTQGQGSTITIRLPLTLAIIDGFAVQAASETYIIPMDFVTECVQLQSGNSCNDTGGVLNLRDEPLPYVRLRHALGLCGDMPEQQSVVVLSCQSGRAGLAVDRLLGETQAIIKPLNRLFQQVPGISGSTILGDGRVAFILDVNLLMQIAIQQAQEISR